MKRVYNDKISARANESLAKRARSVRFEKSLIAIISIIIVSVLILIGSSISTFASSRTQDHYNKSYTSVRIEPGDTLWDLSDKYVIDGIMDRDEFIDEVCKINHISEDDILHSGEYIVVANYTVEE